MSAGGAVRLAVLSPYWGFWQHTVGSGLHADIRRDAEHLARRLAECGEVVGVVQPSTPTDAETAASSIGTLDVVVVHSAMAVPPRTVVSFLKALETIPEVVIFAAYGAGFHISDDFSHGDITRYGATVGAPMLVSALRRMGREPVVVLGRSDDALTFDRLCVAVRRAGGVARLRRARVGVIGSPMPGYDQVVTDPERLHKRLGVTLVQISPGEVSEAFERVEAQRLEALYAELSARFELGIGAEGESLERTLRVAAAIEDLCATYNLDGGAMNCHVPEIRLDEPIGVAPCYAIGRMTSRGTPFTCVGDVLTAVAMVAVASLGWPTLYHELEALDFETGEFVVANSGEHDDRFWPASGRLRIRRNEWFTPCNGCWSLCVEGILAVGPATLVNLVDDADGGYRFVTARGSLSGRGFAGCATTNGAFRFLAPDAVGAWEEWASAGPGHHSCLTIGDASSDIADLARRLGAKYQSIC